MNYLPPFLRRWLAALRFNSLARLGPFARLDEPFFYDLQHQLFMCFDEDCRPYYYSTKHAAWRLSSMALVMGRPGWDRHLRRITDVEEVPKAIRNAPFNYDEV